VQVIRKRLITLHLSTPLDPSSKLDEIGLSRQEGIRLLTEYLDTSYIDAEAWILLSRSYSELGLYGLFPSLSLFLFLPELMKN